jgi:hypothetical protein
MKIFGLALAATLIGSGAAIAAGIDARAYTCSALQSLIAANRFVFVNTPGFDDFVVANASSCSGNEIIQLRTVPTTDNGQCVVNYCKNRTGGGGN